VVCLSTGVESKRTRRLGSNETGLSRKQEKSKKRRPEQLGGVHACGSDIALKTHRIRLMFTKRVVQAPQREAHLKKKEKSGEGRCRHQVFERGDLMNAKQGKGELNETRLQRSQRKTPEKKKWGPTPGVRGENLQTLAL